MPIVNMHDAKSDLSRLVQAVASGETAEVVIARNGVPAARLVPLHDLGGVRLGVAKGQFEVPDDIDGSNAEVANLFAGKRD